ncbi:MAG: hypothetical protein IJ274_00155 [Lachnospiraceae bacterium]|nr:hypothetical protein [Lachnospiraceae bacterium]
MGDMKKIGITSVVTLLVLVLVSSAVSCSIEPIIYHTYQGPIFPLTAVAGAKGVAVERMMELDFTSYEDTVPGETMVPFNEARKTSVNDIYVLNNTTAEDITVEAVYPFVYALDGKKEWMPEIRVDGTEIETCMALGRPVWDQTWEYMDESEEAKVALDGTLNVTMFEWIASDDTYFEEALVGAIDATDEVIVYKFKNIGYDGENEKAYAPNMKVRFVQGEDVEVLPANWNVSGSEEVDGIWKQMIGFDLSKLGQEGYDRDGYLVVLGGDIRDITIQYYASSTGSVLEDVEIEMERYETTLEKVAWEIFEAEYKDRCGEAAEIFPEELLFEIFLKGVCESRDRLLNRVVDGDSIDNSWYHLCESQRVMYAVFDVTIPAGESVRVHAEYEKQAGHGIYEADDDLDRYDILSEEYSALEITSSAVTATGSKKVMADEGENGVEAFLHP